jgi:Haem-degrading
MDQVTRRNFMLTAAAAGSAIGVAGGIAQPSLAQMPQYGADINLEQAKKAIARGQAEARKNNWPVAIAVVDNHGFLVAFEKMDNTQSASVQVAIDKASSAAMYRRPTKAFQDGRRSRNALPQPARCIYGGRWTADRRRRKDHRRGRRLRRHCRPGRRSGQGGCRRRGIGVGRRAQRSLCTARQPAGALSSKGLPVHPTALAVARPRHAMAHAASSPHISLSGPGPPPVRDRGHIVCWRCVRYHSGFTRDALAGFLHRQAVPGGCLWPWPI